MLSELEEIIAYKQFADQPDRQKTLRKTWMKRYVILSFTIPAAIHTCLDSKDVVPTLKFGKEFYKSERLCLPQMTTVSCGSNLRICVANPTICCSLRRQLIRYWLLVPISRQVLYLTIVSSCVDSFTSDCTALVFQIGTR